MRFPRLAFAAFALLLSMMLFFRVMSGAQRQPRRVQGSRCQTRRIPGPLVNELNLSTPENLQSALSTIAKDLRQWRERSSASTNPSIDHVERFIANRAAHARLSAARFALDLELAAMQRGDQEPAKTPVDTTNIPPRHEADVGLPEPATFLCRMLPDGFEVSAWMYHHHQLSRHACQAWKLAALPRPSFCQGLRVRERMRGSALPCPRCGARLCISDGRHLLRGFGHRPLLRSIACWTLAPG